MFGSHHHRSERRRGQSGRAKDATHWMQGHGGHGRRHQRHGDDAFDGDDSFGSGRRRRRRGDIKYVLLELIAEQPRHGYDLIKAMEQRHAGFYRPSPGSVYPTLQLLEDAGHIQSEQVEGKKVYTITAAGQTLLEEWRSGGGATPREPRAEEREQLGSLRLSATALLDSVRQTARHGSPQQVAAVQQIIEQARREVYRTLAQEEDMS